MFIISLSYIAPLSQVDNYINEHIEFLNKQYILGNFYLSGKKVPRSGGVILAKSNSIDALMEIIELDPFKRENLASYEVTKIIPTKASKELEFLIEQ